MTQAFGDAWIEFHGDMDPLDRDIEREADQIRRDDEGHFKRAGEGVGDTLGEAASRRFASHARDFGRRLQEEVRHRPIRVEQRVDVDYDIDSHRLGAEIHQAVSEAFRPGGPASVIGRKLGLAVGDAFGAGFGVSGRSALIPFIVLLVGDIVALVLAAVQAVNALVATLATIPALVTAIGLQVGVLVLAFQGMGTAISGAFAAKNAKELNEAIKGLTPSAQEFVRTLLPLRDLFKYLQSVAQERFFAALGPVISQLQEVLGPILGFNLGEVAAAMGRFVRSLALVFASPSFARLLEEVIPATVRWLDRFGPGFATFLIGWIDLANASLPFFERLGAALSSGLQQFGEWLTRVSQDPRFQKWLSDMLDTLGAVGELLLAATQFVASFMDALNKEGGAQLIRDLAREFQVLAAFFQSEAGQKGMRGFLVLLTGILIVTTGLILLIFTLLGAVQAFVDFVVDDAVPAVARFFEWLGKLIAGSYDSIASAIKATGLIFGLSLTLMGQDWKTFVAIIVAGSKDIAAAIRSIPAQIVGTVSWRAILFNAGKQVTRGLIDGIKSLFPDLGRVAHDLVGKITNVLPGSPAKEGPLSGDGSAMTRGRHLVQDLTKGIQMEIPAMRTSTENMVTNIMFGPGAVSVGFSGVVPTPEQARTTGAAAGQGLLDQLAARDVRLAVRTL